MRVCWAKTRLMHTCIVSSNALAGEEQPTAAGEYDVAPPDDTIAPAAAEKRRRVMAQVPAATGASDGTAAGLSPAKPRTKAARTKANKQKHQPSETELAVPSSYVCA